VAKDYTQMWSTIGLNLKAHDGLLGVLGEAYKNMYLSQKNRPKGMDYFDFVISEIHGLRVEEIVESKKTGKKSHRNFLCLCSQEYLRSHKGVSGVQVCRALSLC